MMSIMSSMEPLTNYATILAGGVLLGYFVGNHRSRGHPVVRNDQVVFGEDVEEAAPSSSPSSLSSHEGMKSSYSSSSFQQKPTTASMRLATAIFASLVAGTILLFNSNSTNVLGHTEHGEEHSLENTISSRRKLQLGFKNPKTVELRQPNPLSTDDLVPPGQIIWDRSAMQQQEQEQQQQLNNFRPDNNWPNPMFTQQQQLDNFNPYGVPPYWVRDIHTGSMCNCGSMAPPVPNQIVQPPSYATPAMTYADRGSTGCKRLGLPQENIPLSPKAFEMDKGVTANFIMVHEKYFYIAYPNEEWLMPHLNSDTGEFRTMNNARMHHRARDAKPGDGIFIDVGGYVGDTALPSAALNIDTYVFEPVRKNTNMIHFSILANSCHVSEHLTVVNALVGDKNSPNESVYVTQRSDNAAATKEQATRNIGDGATDYEQPVEMVMLDSFFPPGTKVQNMKVDVQGFELQVLRGAERLLRENKGRLLLRFEFDSKLLKAAGTDPDELLNFAKSLGYEEVEREHSDMIMK